MGPGMAPKRRQMIIWRPSANARRLGGTILRAPKSVKTGRIDFSFFIFSNSPQRGREQRHGIQKLGQEEPKNERHKKVEMESAGGIAFLPDGQHVHSLQHAAIEEVHIGAGSSDARTV